MRSKKMSRVSETNLGMYVWLLPSGKYLSDDDNNYMNIVARRGDIKAMAKLREAAIYYGFPDGEPKFIEGARRVNQEERLEQLARQKAGLIPDPFDIGNYKEELKWKTQKN